MLLDGVGAVVDESVIVSNCGGHGFSNYFELRVHGGILRSEVRALQQEANSVLNSAVGFRNLPINEGIEGFTQNNTTALDAAGKADGNGLDFA